MRVHPRPRHPCLKRYPRHYPCSRRRRMKSVLPPSTASWSTLPYVLAAVLLTWINPISQKCISMILGSSPHPGTKKQGFYWTHYLPPLCLLCTLLLTIVQVSLCPGQPEETINCFGFFFLRITTLLSSQVCSPGLSSILMLGVWNCFFICISTKHYLGYLYSRFQHLLGS